jgi:hypothetical protein
MWGTSVESVLRKTELSLANRIERALLAPAGYETQTGRQGPYGPHEL